MAFLKKYWLWLVVGGVVVYYWYNRSQAAVFVPVSFINRKGQTVSTNSAGLDPGGRP